MKIVVGTLAVICLLVGAGLYWLLRPVSHVHTLMPGQPLYIRNDGPLDFEIRSEFPVAVKGNGCFALRTADQRFQCGPGNVVVFDLRVLSPLGQSNRVEWIEHQHPFEALAAKQEQQQAARRYEPAPIAPQHIEAPQPQPQAPQQPNPVTLADPESFKQGSDLSTWAPAETVPARGNHAPRSFTVPAEVEAHITNVDCRSILVESERTPAIAGGSCLSLGSNRFHCQASTAGELLIRNTGEPLDVTLACAE